MSDVNDGNEFAVLCQANRRFCTVCIDDRIDGNMRPCMTRFAFVGKITESAEMLSGRFVEHVERSVRLNIDSQVFVFQNRQTVFNPADRFGRVFR